MSDLSLIMSAISKFLKPIASGINGTILSDMAWVVYSPAAESNIAWIKVLYDENRWSIAWHLNWVGVNENAAFMEPLKDPAEPDFLESIYSRVEKIVKENPVVPS